MANKPRPDPPLVEITAPHYPVDIQLVYGTANSFVCLPVYGPDARCALHADAASCLMRAALAARRTGCTLRIFDAYRPPAAQAIFWRLCPDPRYIADPVQGSNHTRGVAVDVTLVAADGQALDMGTGFDEMREQSHHDHAGLPPDVQRNRNMLLDIMLQAGFESLPAQWWHYQLPDAGRYPLLDDPIVQVRRI